MAGSLNQVQLIGNLGADPEIRRTQGGNAVANFSVATTKSWRDRNSGEKREKTDWHNIVVWNEGLAKVCEQYLRKGAKVFIQGELQTRKWQDQAGNDRYTTEVVLQGFAAQLLMLDGRSNGDDDRGSSRGGGNSRSNSRNNDDYGGGYGGGGSGGNFSRDLDDDIPFEMPWR